MPSLFVIQGRDRGHRFEIDSPNASIGRDVGNSIRLQDTEVSRRHAEIHDGDDGLELIDLDSSNGTYVNGEVTQRSLLASGDQVQCGRTLMLFTAGVGHNAVMSAAMSDESVNIIAPSGRDESHIVRSMTEHEGSREIFGAEITGGESPWLARARSNLQVMYRTALAVSHTLDIDELLGRILELIFEWVEADRGCIMLVNNDTERLEPRVRRNREGFEDEATIRISQTILDYVTEHAEGVLTSNAKDDKRWDTGASILQMDIREAICVPMRGRYGVVGVIYIDTSTPPQKMLQQGGNTFREEHLKLMIAIAHQAALAVEDTSYYSAMLQAERLAAIGQTIASLSHHIKNILQGIRGGSYLIEMGLADDDKDVVKKGWHIVERNQGRISNLVMDMLTFSKEREPEMTPSQMNETVGDVVEMMQSRATELGVQLRWHPADDLPELMFDTDGIHRAVLNVVTNAIDACESVDDGSVDVAVEYDAESQQIRIVVRDNGSGIPKDEIEKMFSIFVSSKGSQGTGLGLSVSQKILREHGGQIRVESQPGEGSCFTLEIPAVLPETSQTMAESDAS